MRKCRLGARESAEGTEGFQGQGSNYQLPITNYHSLRSES